jgi:hypothetical protein
MLLPEHTSVGHAYVAATGTCPDELNREVAIFRLGSRHAESGTAVLKIGLSRRPIETD